jgi:DNA-binding MarR family transcriptional regulator
VSTQTSGDGGTGPDEAKAAWLEARSGVYREYLAAINLNGQATAEALGLHPTDSYALNVLELAGPVTAGELSERTGLTTGAATRLIDRLERAGRVRRRADPADRRRVIVETVPLPAGELDEALAPARRHLAEVFLAYDHAQLEVLFDYFTRAVAALRDATAELREAAPARRRRG